MPIEHAIWKIDESPQRLAESTLRTEQELENMITADVSILSDQWMLIGRQVTTPYNKFIDLLAIDTYGSLIVIELKKRKTSREVVAQAIDYASWVKTLDAAYIANLYKKFSHDHKLASDSLDEAFFHKFGIRLEEDELNSSHQIVVVTSELDSSTERIIQYLNDLKVPINAAKFRVFKDKDTRYISRVWFIDPAETQEHATMPRSPEAWNKEYYVSFGHNQGRNWDDARQYGFISGGGGRWYSQTLNQLTEGNRVWVNIPRIGYVGVGIVESRAVKVDEFKVKTEKGEIPLLQAPINDHYHKKWVNDEDKAEYIVRVRWIKQVPLEEAKSELGFFGNQNTVCKPTTPKWNHTVNRLKEIFDIE